MTDRKREPRLQQKLENEETPGYLDGLPKDTYLTDIFSTRAADFVERSKSDKPWFLFLSYNAPHTPIMVSKEKMAKHALQSPEKKTILSKKLDAWVKQVRKDAERLTPKP